MGTPLDPTNPQTIDVAEETLNIRHSEFSSEESLLMSAFSLLTAPPNLTVELHRSKNAPLPPFARGFGVARPPFFNAIATVIAKREGCVPNVAP